MVNPLLQPPGAEGRGGSGPATAACGYLDAEGNINWDDITESLPAFLTIILMPLTFSIANGVSLGVISYTLLKLLAGQGREVSPILYGLAALLLPRNIWLME